MDRSNYPANAAQTLNNFQNSISTGAVAAGRETTTHTMALDASEVLPDLVCFSHLRWDFVFQRPQHLLNRFATHTRVFVVEEPVWDAQPGTSTLEIRSRGERLWIVTPHLPGGISPEENYASQRQLFDKFLNDQRIEQFMAWYYTPMALGFSRHLQPVLTVYDCMDELSAFAGAPPELIANERELFERADLVFTGGQSLYEAKRERHPRVYAFPSSIDFAHFAQARTPLPEPADQQAIPHPRLGFFGVIDERLDISLVAEVARQRPEWQLVLLGPVVKIDPATLPQAPNLHYLGMKSYQELPGYISSWEVALLPFAMNESTRFISPTKTPEYLAAGKPVVSTPVRDVVKPYGESGMVHIASTAEEFVAAVEQALEQRHDAQWRTKVDQYLSQLSWNQTWERMVQRMRERMAQQVNG